MGLRAITTSASPLPWSTNISPLPTFNLFSAQSLKWRKPNASFQGKWGCSSEQKQLKFNGHNSANGSLPNPLGSLVEGGQKIAMVSSRREGLLSLVLLAGCISLAQSKARALGEKGMLTLERYNDNKEGFTLLRPSDWKKVDKAGATVLFEDPEVKSNNIGVVVNPVRISSLKEFGTPQDVADKLLQAEKKKAKSELKRSAVADNDSGNSAISEVRTSSGMFIPKGKDAIVTRIEDKIAAWTFLPRENGEDLQVLRYEHGQKYDPHFDYFQDKVNIVRGGHRLATVLMYLTDVEKGGETVFPSAEDDTHGRVNIKDDTLSDCAKKGVAVKPKRGDALLFFSLTPGAVTDPRSLHAGCPVIQGEKWSATKWIHVESFDKLKGSETCMDDNDRCGEWAAYGECMNNPEYMVGSANLPGACRKSCKVC